MRPDLQVVRPGDELDASAAPDLGAHIVTLGVARSEVALDDGSLDSLSEGGVSPISSAVPATKLVGICAPPTLSATSAASRQRVNGMPCSRVACRQPIGNADDDFDAVIDSEWQKHLASLGEELSQSKGKGGAYWRAWFDAMHLEVEYFLDKTAVESD